MNSTLPHDTPAEKLMEYILIVQDCENIANLAIRVLERHGYHTYAVSNSAEALDILQESNHLPRLVLLDLCTPVMDGVAFRQAQRQNARLATIPVVAFSSYSNILARGAHGLFDGYLPLPCTTDEIVQIVAQFYPLSDLSSDTLK
jgi:CheY-like chemotaxis protein